VGWAQTVEPGVVLPDQAVAASVVGEHPLPELLGELAGLGLGGERLGHVHRIAAALLHVGRGAHHLHRPGVADRFQQLAAS